MKTTRKTGSGKRAGAARRPARAPAARRASRSSTPARRPPRTSQADVHAMVHGWAVTALLVTSLGWPFGAGAMQPLQTDDAGTQGAGHHQVELGGALERDTAREAGARVRTEGGSTALVTSSGLHDDLDLIVGGGLQWTRARAGGAEVSREGGFGDGAVDVKWRFYEAGDLKLALKPGITLPTGDAGRGLGDGRVGYRAALIASHGFGALSLHLNGGYARHEYARSADRSANRADVWKGSMAAIYDVGERLHLAADVGVSTNPARGERTPPAYALVGVAHGVSESVDLSLGVKAGLTRPEPDLGVLLGFTWRL